MGRVLRYLLAHLMVGGLLLGFWFPDPAGARLRFPHPKHKDVECATCHPGAAKSSSGEERLLPDSEACLTCHEKGDLENWGWSKAMATHGDFPMYSHARHLAMEGLTCSACHGALGDPLLAGTGKGEIGHSICLTCHNGLAAKAECGSCHGDIRRVRPLDHGPDYLHAHQFNARGVGETCEECHGLSESCSECHQGENLLTLTHDRNYLFTHAEDARKHESDCTSCHDLASFCSDCHLRENIAPAGHFTLAWTLGGHGIEARRDILYCAGCHDEGDPICARCHSDKTPGRGNDTSIHATDFSDRDARGPWHEDDSYFCFDCHTRSTAPEGFCGYCHSPREE